MNNKQTTSEMAHIAAEVLNDGKATKREKSLAGSVLSQTVAPNKPKPRSVPRPKHRSKQR